MTTSSKSAKSQHHIQTPSEPTNLSDNLLFIHPLDFFNGLHILLQLRLVKPMENKRRFDLSGRRQSLVDVNQRANIMTFPFVLKVCFSSSALFNNKEAGFNDRATCITYFFRIVAVPS